MTVKIGRLPSINTFIPQTPLTQLGVVATTAASMHYAYSFTNDGTIAGLATTASLFGVWLYGRYTSLGLRDGYLLEKPIPKKIQSETNANWEMTNLFKANGFDTVVYERHSEQYKVLLIKNDEPYKVEKMLSKVSMKLGIDQKELKFIQTYKKATSAILIPLVKDQWKPVKFDQSQLEQGKLIGYIGKSVSGDHIKYDRRVEPHLLIAGDTNSGKTEAMRVDIESMKQSGLNPQIIIIDPKEDMTDINCDFYTSDNELGVQKLESIAALAEVRKAKYSKASCKNYFEYQARIDPSETPIMIYIDEIADLLAPDLLEELEKGDHPIHKRAFAILFKISRKYRAAGIFLTLGIQHPKAEVLKTEIRNNLGARLVLSMADRKASEVAIDQGGAETLPKFGAFMFKTSLTNAPIVGRGAYLK
jgi:hypothetical protein